jgi:isoleucyl-tRNA synthetase
MMSTKVEDIDHLTENGKRKVLNYIPELKNKKIDLIISSDFLRTKETAEIIKKGLGISDNNLIFDKRIREVNTGVFEGKTWDEFFNFRERKSWYSHAPQSGESGKEEKFRMTNFLYDLENRYQNKNILIVSHEGPIRVLVAGMNGLNDEETEEFLENKIKSVSNTQTIELPFVPLPHNENYELDLHRPYIDEIKLVCDCGGDLVRTKEVMDVWFDSGAMPFAQDHYPFENQKLIDKDGGYPADFISEAIDQTRGWFYTLHAIGILMGRGKAYKNVICLGHLMDAVGKKMSKSVGNIVDPWDAINKYGVDTLRLWMYSVNQPGESKNFDEKTVQLLQQQVFTLLYNVLAFYELYPIPEQARYGAGRDIPKSENVLDQWILARLNELTNTITENLDNYKLLEPVRAIRDFIGDLSTWYLRRSRERIKDGDKNAKQTLYFVLKTLAKLMAPFAPFTAEDIWLKLRTKNDLESVHLVEWPKVNKFDNDILNQMNTVRDYGNSGHSLRQKLGKPVKQPLGAFFVPVIPGLLYKELLKDELNVKDIKVSTAKGDINMYFDEEITGELKQEGNYRELVRALQDMRKKMGLTPSDAVSLVIETDEQGKKLVQKFEKDLKKTVLVLKVEFGKNDGEGIKIDGLVFRVKIVK